MDVILVVWFCVCTARTGKRGWGGGWDPGKGGRGAPLLCPAPTQAWGDLEPSSALVRGRAARRGRISCLCALLQVEG